MQWNTFFSWVLKMLHFMWFMLCIITMQALCRSGTTWASCEVNPVIQWPFDFQGLTRVDDQWS
jgi:hypothetical protein